MKKVGICTLYHENKNFGGVLQAYALTRVIKKLGYDAEQIRIKRVYQSGRRKRKFMEYFNIRKIYLKLKLIFAQNHEARKLGAYKEVLVERNNAMCEFSMSIPHSKKIYNDDTICNCNEDYDIFVAGSDQVWGQMNKMSPYLLNFVSSDKRKFSYAASMGYTFLDEASKTVYAEALVNYFAISVREKDAVEMLQSLTDVSVEQSLDPTLLLTKQEWDEISAERAINERYLLCYFLSDGSKLKKLAVKYAQKHNLKIVTFPHCPNNYHKSDRGFGDYQIYNAGPQNFISYIKHAECVFTDSFHGSVFSLIYERQFFVFNRKGENRMVSRIYSLMDLFECSERFCNTERKITIEYIEGVNDLNYKDQFKNYQNKKKASCAFLTRCLRGKHGGT